MSSGAPETYCRSRTGANLSAPGNTTKVHMDRYISLGLRMKTPPWSNCRSGPEEIRSKTPLRLGRGISGTAGNGESGSDCRWRSSFSVGWPKTLMRGHGLGRIENLPFPGSPAGPDRPAGTILNCVGALIIPESGQSAGAGSAGAKYRLCLYMAEEVLWRGGVFPIRVVQ